MTTQIHSDTSSKTSFQPACPLTLTQRAYDHLVNLLNSKGVSGIRLRLRTKGCSGMSYVMEYVNTPGAEDIVISLVDTVPSIPDLPRNLTAPPSPGEDGPHIQGAPEHQTNENSEDLTKNLAKSFQKQSNLLDGGMGLKECPLEAEVSTAVNVPDTSRGDKQGEHASQLQPHPSQLPSNSSSNPGGSEYSGPDQGPRGRMKYLLIHKKALMFLIGSEMDYDTSPTRSGFIFRNPQEKGRCGCGTSFHV